jgi:uncharacterized membrane protein YfcA
VNASEFLITLSVSMAFLIALLTGHWQDAGEWSSHAISIAGLIVGGLVAAPLAGWIVRHFPEKLLLRAVGTIICILALAQTVQQLMAS